MRALTLGFLFIVCLGTVSVGTAPSAMAQSQQSFTGTYTTKMEDVTFTLRLEQGKDGTLTGSLSYEEETLRFSGRVDNGKFSGMTQPDDPEEKAEVRISWE